MRNARRAASKSPLSYKSDTFPLVMLTLFSCHHAGSTSVRAKSWPLNSKGSRVLFRQRVGEAVTEVQSCRVVALAESPARPGERPAPGRGVTGTKSIPASSRNSSSSCPAAAPLRPSRTMAASTKTDDRHAAACSFRYRLVVELRPAFAEKDCHDCRRIDDHFGSPRSS